MKIIIVIVVVTMVIIIFVFAINIVIVLVINIFIDYHCCYCVGATLLDALESGILFVPLLAVLLFAAPIFPVLLLVALLLALPFCSSQALHPCASSRQTDTCPPYSWCPVKLSSNPHHLPCRSTGVAGCNNGAATDKAPSTGDEVGCSSPTGVTGLRAK